MMRARRCLSLLLVLLLLLSQAQAEQLTLYTRPETVDDSMPFQLRPTTLRIRSVTRAMGGVVILAHDENAESLLLYFWQDGMKEMQKLGGGLYAVESEDSMAYAQRYCEYAMSRVPRYVMPDLNHAISFLTSDGETLYAFNKLNGLIFTIEAADDGLHFQDCCTLSDLSCLNIAYLDSETKQTYVYDASVEPLGVHGQVMALQVEQGQGRGYQVLLIDLQDGSVRAIQDDRLLAAYEWAQGEILLCRSENATLDNPNANTYCLTRYSIESGEETLLSAGVPYANLGRGAYDSTSGMYYAVQTWQVVRTKDFVQEEPVATFPKVGMSIAVTESSIVGMEMSVIYVRSKENGSMTVLHLQSNGGINTNTLQPFAEEHPEVILSHETIYDDDLSAAKIAEAMNATSDALDALWLYMRPQTVEADGNWPLDVLMDKGYCMDLSVYPDVAAYVAQLNGIFRDAVTRDGRIYALPINAWGYNGFFINRSVMDKLGLQESDIPTNFVDLCAFITNWNDHLDGAYAAYAPLDETEDYHARMFDLMLREWVGYCQAENLPLRFDSPIFRAMMAALDAMRTDNIEQANQHVNEDISDYRESLIWTNVRTVGNFANYAESGSRIFLPMALTRDTSYHYGIEYMTLFIVNPRTKNTELIGELLTKVLETQGANAKCVLLAGYSEAVEEESYQSLASSWEEQLTDLRRQKEQAPEWKQAGLQERINQLEADYYLYRARERWQIAPKTIALYQETILPLCFLRRPSRLAVGAGKTAFADLVAQVDSGEMSLEAFVQEADALMERME